MTPEQAALIGTILRNAPALPDAACRSRPELMENPDSAAEAISLCHECPALGALQAWAVQQRKLFGVVAGSQYENAGERGKPL